MSEVRITEEPYDGSVAWGLVSELMAELNVRYDSTGDPFDDQSDEDYLAEVTPEMVRRPCGAFFVAWLHGAPVGCGALKPLDLDPAHGEIKRMYTVPAARRRGISRRILVRLEEAAAELGYRWVQLETGLAQPEAVAMYESHGWQRIEPYGHYKHSPLSVCFGKDIPPR